MRRRVADINGDVPPRVVASGNFASPSALLDIVDGALPSYLLFMLNAQRGIPSRPGVQYETAFVGAGMRGSPTLRYLPARLSMVPDLFAGPLPPDLVLLHTSRPRGSRVSLGTEVNILPAAVEAAKARGALVVAQLNAKMPYTFGDSELDTDVIDVAIEVDTPLASPAARAADQVSTAIAGRVAALVPDGATLQLGIGAVPDATLAQLTGRRGLKVWTEMFSDGVLALEETGALDPNTQLTTSFLFGTARLYEWAANNQRIRMTRTESTNDPAQIADRPALNSINGALQVDLYGRANAARVRGRIYSGFGGSTDFIVGALHSPQGQAIIALPSWHPKADCSTIVAQLTEPATSFQHSWVVSEQGAASMYGATEAEQATALIETVAHPTARPDLRAAAADRFGVTTG